MLMINKSEELRVLQKTPDLKLSAAVANLTPNPGAEIVRYARDREDVIFLGQGEGDLPTPDFITNAAAEALQRGETFYGPSLGRPELREALSTYYKNVFNLDISANRTFVTASASKALNFVLKALLNPGDEFVAQTPVWRNLISAAELAEAKIVEAPLVGNDGHWSFDPQILFDACTENTKAILITSPSNPTGWTMNHDEMRLVLDFARERDIWIISDEVYSRIVFDGVRSPSFLDIANPDDRLFVVNSFSKSWAMTGWRLGWLVGPAGVENHIRDIALYDMMCPPSFAQFGAIAALEQGEPYLKERVSLWRSNMNLICNHFAGHDRVRMAKPDASFYTFFKVEGLPDARQLAFDLVDNARVGLSPGCSFGKAGRGYLRLCFAISEGKFKEAVERLDKAFI